MTLQIALELKHGSFDLQLKIEVQEGETLAVVGPNGAGKSTLLQAIAGIRRIDRGAISLDGQLLDGGPDSPFIAAEDRNFGYVFQDHRLFPSMTALDNVAFGLRARGKKRPDARRRALEWLERVGIKECQGLYPQQLSGGQSQRVAIARALAIEPRILLLDEPISAVDASARIDLRRTIKKHLQSSLGMRLVVAHDIEDVVSLADRIAVMEEGRLVQVGRVEEVVQCPASRYASDLVGLNFYSGNCGPEGVRVGQLDFVVATDLVGPVTLTIHPRAVSLFSERPHGSPRNSWLMTVVAVEPSLGRFRVVLDGPLTLVAEVTASSIHELSLSPGRPIWATVKATEITLSPS